MTLTDKQKRFLKGLAHNLKPVVMLGNNGLTESVLAEIENALEHHELIKVKVNGQERNDRVVILNEIASSSNANLVQTIGNIGVIYRESKKMKIQLPR